MVRVAGSVTAATRWRLPHGCAAMAQHQPSWQGLKSEEAEAERLIGEGGSGQRVDESADDGHAEDVRGLSASPGFLCGGKKPSVRVTYFSSCSLHSVLPALSISEIWVLTQLMTERWKMQPSFCLAESSSSGSADWALSTGTLFVLLRWLSYWKMRTLVFRFRFHFYCTEQEIHLTCIISFFSLSGFLFPSTKLTKITDRNRIKTECWRFTLLWQLLNVGAFRVKYKHNSSSVQTF